jgi:hypothetical protein
VVRTRSGRGGQGSGDLSCIVGVPRSIPADHASSTIGAVIDRDLLSEVDLFRELDPPDLDRLVTHARSRQLQRGDVLFREGDEADTLFVVVRGRVAIANKSIDGRESMVALMERGDLFGEMPLFDHQNRSAEARALEVSEVITFPFGPLLELYTEQPRQLWPSASARWTRPSPIRCSST